MATTVLGEASILTVNAVALTDFLDTVTFTKSADSLDISTFGNLGHRKRGGLTDGSIAIGGVYDTTAAGPHDVLQGLVGTVVAFQWRPEGAGVGLAQYAGNVLVQNYVESAAVADVVRWTAALEIDGNLVLTNQ